ncbi:MAG TPA: hypothetical protein VF469_25940 [Kofleriaceae bacterium]
MTASLFKYRLPSTQLLSPFALAAYAALSAACAVPPSEGSGHAPPPPGTIEIARPPRLTERARVPEKQPGFIAAEVHDSEITFSHDAAFPPLAVGDVLGGTLGGGYLVRVIAVQEVDSTHVVVETTPAALTELLAEGEFHVHYDAMEYAAHLDDYIAAQQARGDKEGERTAAEVQALGVTGPSIPLLDLASTPLPVSCGGSAMSPAEIGADARLTPSLDIDVKIGPRGGLDLRPELKRFRIIASGQLDVSATLHGKGTTQASCTVNLLGLAGGAVSVPLPTLTFWVGPVPVIVTSEVVPVATADLSLTFQAAEVAAEAKTSVGLDAGVDYADRKWSIVWNPHGSADGDASIQSSTNIGAMATVSAGAEFRARLYGVLGPNLGVVAYTRTRAESPPPYCTYDARVDGGVRGYAEAALGVSVGPLDLTLAELPLVSMDLAHFDGRESSGKLRDAPECSE